MATPETPKEKQGENYETIKLILDDIKKLDKRINELSEQLDEIRLKIVEVEW